MQTIVTKKQRQKITNAETFTSLLQIAMKSITTARKKYKGAKVIELCAPISSGGKGSVEANLAEMNKAIKMLKKLNYILFSQMPYEEKIGELKKEQEKKTKRKLAYNMNVLLDFYEPLFEKGYTDMLIFLPGWESSIGASWEHTKGKILGIKTRQLKDNWAELIAKGEKDIKKLTFKI